MSRSRVRSVHMHAALQLLLTLLCCLLSRAMDWPQKSSLFLFRTDGMSCSRELVTGVTTAAAALPLNPSHRAARRMVPSCSICMQPATDAAVPAGTVLWCALTGFAVRKATHKQWLDVHTNTNTQHRHIVHAVCRPQHPSTRQVHFSQSQSAHTVP
jgi:hypothetical protein